MIPFNDAVATIFDEERNKNQDDRTSPSQKTEALIISKGRS